VGFWDKIGFGKSAACGTVDPLVRSDAPGDIKGSAKFYDPPETLFINPKEPGQAVIVAAEIKSSQQTGRRYIRVELFFNRYDPNHSTTLGRMAYTSYVILAGLGKDYDDEEYNVSELIGKTVCTRTSRKMIPNRNDPVWDVVILKVEV